MGMPSSFLENLFSVEDRIVLVTGASRGIGIALATAFSKAGSRVFGLGRTRQISKSKNFLYKSLDINDQSSFKDYCIEITKKWGKINVLINAAGISVAANEQVGSEVFEKIVDTNLSATFRCCEIASEFMDQGGSIINITSIASKLGFPGNPGYQASKAGLAAVSRALACDLAERYIRVNSITPGYIRTEMTRASYENESLRKQRSNRMIIQRWGEVNDLTGAAIYLASDASAYVTGSEIVVDGGWSIKGM